VGVQPLNFAKLASPRRGKVLPRPRLTQRLRQGLDRKLTLVVAGAGFGKTTLLADGLAGAGVRVAWYRLDATDQDVAQFVSYLIAAVREYVPDFGRDVQRAIARLHQSPDMQRRLVGLVAHAFSSLPPEPLVIVLDGYDLIDGSDAVAALLTYMLPFSPPQLRFVMATRNVPSLPLTELRVAGELVEFGAEALAFSATEIADFLSMAAGADVNGEEAAQLLERTEGWPVGVALAATMLGTGTVADLLGHLGGFSGEVAAVYERLTTEVFGRLGPDTQRFLLFTSLFDELYVDACDHLLGTTDARERLIGLEAQGLFTQEAGGSGSIRGHYRYHRLFRDFLRERLRRTLPAEEWSGWLESAGRIMEARGAWQSALAHYMDAHSYEAAANTLERVGVELLDGGAQQAIIRFLDQVPPEIVWRRPWLLALRGRILRRQYQLEIACTALDRANAMFASARDEKGQGWVACEMAAVDFRRAAHRAAVARLRVALTRSSDSALRTEMLVRLASNAVAAGELTEGLASGRLARAGLAVLPPTSYNDSQRITLRLAEGLALAAQGRVDEAGAALHAVDALGEADGFAAHSTGSRLGHSAEIALLSGDPTDALRRLDRAEPLLAGDAFWLRRIQRLRGDAFLALGQLTEAAAAYDLAGSLGWTGRALVYLRQAHLVDALRLAELSWTDLRGADDALVRESARVVYGIALREHGQTRPAIQHLTDARRFFAGAGYCWQLIGVDLHLARAYLALDDPTWAPTIREAVQRAAKAGPVTLPWWEPRTVADLCVGLLRWDSKAGPIVCTLVPRLTADAREILRRLPDVPSTWHAQLLDAALNATDPNTDAGTVLGDLVSTCRDQSLRAQIASAMAATSSERIVRVLRRDYLLTWREIQVLLVYYLEPSRNGYASAAASRRDYAESLGLAENTLKVHIANLRRKLALSQHASLRALLAELERLQGTPARQLIVQD
jgi:ATP/maltotriose-dependent transcriptional regulator MalT